MLTFDRRTIDGTGAFLISELERVNYKVNAPLVSYTWSRDVDLREDVTIADEIASFVNSTFAAPGGMNPTGKNWIGGDVNAIPGVALDLGKTAQPLHLWGMELSWTVVELEKAIKLGRPVDAQKMDAMNLKHQMDIDEQVYIGDSTLLNCYGLVNNPGSPVTNAPNGAAGSGTWASKTYTEVLADVNTLINATWAASGYKFAPNRLLLPPAQYGKLVSSLVGTSGTQSIIQFLRDNSLTNSINGSPLEIYPCKWLTGRGVGGLDRAVIYTKDPNTVVFPMTPLQRTPLEYKSIWQLVTYYGRLGQVEFHYDQTFGYLDGI